jgi:transcriptional regulator with XRE-family HTH domain
MLTKMKVVKTVEVEVQGLKERIKEAVEKDTRSVQFIATAVGVSSATIYNLMNGKSDRVSLDTLQKLGEVLQADLGVEFSDVT